MNKYIVAVDFDGTVVSHMYPEIGDPTPGANAWLRIWQLAGAEVVLFTMRSGASLEEAVAHLSDALPRPLYGVNTNPTQKSWTSSPKAYAHIYVDDAAFGCPLRPAAGGRPQVDWRVVGPAVFARITGREAPRSWVDLAEAGTPISEDVIKSALVGI